MKFASFIPENGLVATILINATFRPRYWIFNFGLQLHMNFIRTIMTCHTISLYIVLCLLGTCICSKWNSVLFDRFHEKFKIQLTLINDAHCIKNRKAPRCFIYNQTRRERGLLSHYPILLRSSLTLWPLLLQTTLSWREDVFVKEKKSLEEEERKFRIEAIFFSSKWGGGGYLPCYFWRAGFPPILPITYQKPDGKMLEWPTKTDFQVPELSF